jgi:ABC-2 type transport system permease protein
MSYPMVRRLILKDWHFQRWPIAGLLALGATAIVVIAVGGNGSFYIGSILLLTVLITTGIVLPMMTVIGERKGQTLAFVMTLPISTRDYAVAKILANLLIFLIPFTTLGAATLGLFWLAGSFGLIPFTLVILGELFASYCLLLGVAVVSESEGWTIGVMAAANLFFQGFIYYVAHMPGIGSTMSGHTMVWNRGGVSILAGELALSVVFVVLTFVLQERKTDFL